MLGIWASANQKGSTFDGRQIVRFGQPKRFRSNCSKILPAVMFDKETVMRTEASREVFQPKCCKKRNIQARLTALRRFGISIGPKEKKPYVKSNSICDCRSCVVSRHHSDADRGVHRGERESHSAGGREANPDLRPQRSLSLPFEPRTITIGQRGE
jgi:hypothetical protein